MHIDVLTLFPDMFTSPFSESIVKRAIDKKLLSINYHNIRSFAEGPHMQVDDYPYGGGQGMVMKVDVLHRCLGSIQRNEGSHAVYLSPRGSRLNQPRIVELASYDHIILLCGHYEGVDERIMDQIDEEISIGDYVLTGGELPAMILIDALARMIPGVLGNHSSAIEESFQGDGLLEYPQYTRPAGFSGKQVPDILLSGHHENIRYWRKTESMRATLLKRPDLLIGRKFSKEEKDILMKILFDEEGSSK